MSSLIIFCLLIVASATAAAAAAVAPTFRCGDGNETRLMTETLGGLRVEQQLRLAATAMHGCRWILDGGDFTDYVDERDEAADGSGGCRRVRVTGGPSGGSWTASVPSAPELDPRLVGKCQHQLGVDCRFHLTAYQAADRPCPYEEGNPVCPEGPRQLASILGGRRVNATWIQLDLMPGNASSCAWVLLGSSASLWTLASESPIASRACLTCSRSGDTAGEAACSPPAAKLAAPGCQQRLGPDCRPYLVDAVEPSLPCRERSAAAASADSRSQQASGASASDAGFKMLMSDDKARNSAVATVVSSTLLLPLLPLPLLLLQQVTAAVACRR